MHRRPAVPSSYRARSGTPRHLAAGALLLAACGGDDAATTRAAADSASRASLARAEASAGSPVSITQEREADLTGDGVPELLRVTARGPNADSLAVTLTVRDAAGTIHFRETWRSDRWLARIDPALRTPAIADSVVRRRVDDLLADAAFVRPATVEAPTVARDVAERAWRRTNGLADSLPLPGDAHAAIDRVASDTTRVQALVAELRRQPSLRWLAGDGHQAIAWSPSERRFVRVQRCC